MLKRLIYPVFAVVLLGGYSTAMILDWDLLSSVDRYSLPPEARRSPGAYRAPIFWTGTGFSGGK